MIDKDIGQKIKERRKQLHMTQVELAEKIGFTDHSSVGKIETGMRDITREKLREIARVLNMDPCYLLDMEDAIPPIELTDEEMLIIDAYRKHPEIQAAVKKLLDV